MHFSNVSPIGFSFCKKKKEENYFVFLTVFQYLHSFNEHGIKRALASDVEI